MFVVAGVTGHVGSVVAQELLAKGEKVKVIVRDLAKGASWAKAGAEVAVGELENADFLTGVLKGAVGFFTLLPPNNFIEGFYAFQRKTADAIAAAVKTSGVPHVVLLSSLGADLSDGTGPIKGLHYLERALRATGVKLTVVRAGSFQENVANALGPAKAAGIYPNMIPSADYPMPMIATRDIGFLAAHELLIPGAKSEVIDLVGPAYTIRQAAELLGVGLGKKLQIVQVPPEGQAGAFLQAGLKPELAGALAEMNAAFASGRVQPVGDRMKVGRTPLEWTVRAVLGH